MNSYLVPHLSAVKRSELHLLLVSEPIIQISLYLLMRVLLIAERLIVDELGPYVEGRLLARHFSVEDNGESYIQSITTIQLR
jgi:hypothetical protein